MSKFAILGTLANVVATVGIATPVGIAINKEKQNRGWNSGFQVDEKSRARTFGSSDFTTREQKATQELYNWICYENIYKTKLHIKQFCLTTQDLVPNIINLDN